MAATPTTKSQVQAYRFVLRRMEHALVRKDAVMLHDPMRTQVRATVVGVVLGVLGLAGFALFSLFSHSDSLGDNAIVTAKDSGTMFVRVDGVLHPVTNLASARLINRTGGDAERSRGLGSRRPAPRTVTRHPRWACAASRRERPPGRRVDGLRLADARQHGADR